MIPRKLIYAAFSVVFVGTVATSANAGVTKPGDVKFNDETVTKSLSGKSGDPVAGRKAAINRKKGNCLACHTLPIPEQPFHGEVGPGLNDVGSRLNAAELRGRIVNPKIANPDTIMPAFYRVSGFHRVQKKWAGKTMLSAQEVEDIVAYLLTLKGKYSN